MEARLGSLCDQAGGAAGGDSMHRLLIVDQNQLPAPVSYSDSACIFWTARIEKRNSDFHSSTDTTKHSVIVTRKKIALEVFAP